MKHLEIAVLVMLWTVTLWRLPSALRTAKQRALWTAFAALTLSMTLRLPEVIRGLDEWAGINNLSTLVKHWLGMIAAGAVVEFVVAIARPETGRRPRTRHYVALTAMTVMAVLFIFLVPRPYEAADFFEENVGHGWATVYYLVFVVYLGIAMATATRLFWGSARHASARWLRTGVRLMGIGTAIGVLYTLVRAGYMTSRLVGLTDSTSDVAVDNATDVLKYMAIGFILVGSSIPAFGVAWRTVQDGRHHRQLQPLWQDLTAVTPDIVLKAGLLRSPRLRLYRRVIEIRDAALALDAYAAADIRERARTAARRAGFDPETSPAAEALWMRAARETKGRGALPAANTRKPGTEGIDDLDFTTEVDRLIQLARIYHSPVADEFLTATTRETTRETTA
ncbi:MAB_1171c family putative transporter [Streptomyces sp. NPDC059443]|uniref:MAB_1171c family putative transporter n=1 Tax=unclassified Streptomyces TaxID=2593676 RepID=UPI0036869A46